MKPCRGGRSGHADHPGCPQLTNEGKCPKHRTEEQRQVDASRGGSTERGYGYRWQKYRERFLRENPLCAICEREDRPALATVVDHIKPHHGDQGLFWTQTIINQRVSLATIARRRRKMEDGEGRANKAPVGAGKIAGSGLL